MATDIVLRSVKAAALTHAEADQNWESLAQTVDAVTASATIAITDQNKILEVSITTGTMTLPTVANAAGTDTDSFRITIKNINTTVLIVDGNGAETIEGAASVNLLENESATFALSSGAAEWNIVSFYGPNGVGLTASPAEINTLNGITASTAELNYNDISALGAAQASKTMTMDAAKGISGITFLTCVTINASTAFQIGGVTLTPTAVETNYVSGVTSAIQTQIDGKQASDAGLTDLAGLAVTNSNFIVGDGTNWVAESGATARTSLGVDVAGTDNSTDVTLAGTGTHRSLSGQALTINKINLTSGTDVSGTLPAGNIGTNAVTTVKINALAVTNAKLAATAVSESKIDWANFKGVSQVMVTGALDTTATAFGSALNMVSYIYIPANASTLNYTAVYNVNIVATNCYLRIKTASKTGSTLGNGTNIGDTTTYAAFGTNPTGTLDVSDVQATLVKIIIEGYTDTAGSVRFRNVTGYFT